MRLGNTVFSRVLWIGAALALEKVVQTAFSEGRTMTKFKLVFAVTAAALMSVSSVAEAQSYSQRGTRQGAVAGAIIGGVIGNRNNEALAGAAIGGLVGAAAGRAIGQSKDSRYAYGGFGGNSFYQQPNFYNNRGFGGYSTNLNIYSTRPSYGYSRGYGGGGLYGYGGGYNRNFSNYGRSYGGGRSSCPNSRW
jgi:hypothetical protein